MALPESHDHIELIDGEIVVAPSPFPLHQALIVRLVRTLSPWADSHPPAFLGVSPLDVRLGPERIVQPDLALWLTAIDLRRLPVPNTPDLAIEILSARRTYDRIAKRLLYFEADVREYWIVDADERAVEMVVGLATVETAREALESRVAPGLRLDVAALFRDLP